MVESMGSGVVVFDYDGDGDHDLFFVDGASLPGYDGEAPRSRLFRNDGRGRFVDVTERSGIVVRAYGIGAVAGDVDGDGDLDLYLTSFGANQLFVNQGDGTFRDATEEAGVGATEWSASATLADLDGDGDLDLYVTHYVDFTLDNNPSCGLPSRDLRSYCHPDVFGTVPDRFYRNRGDGTFEEATAAAGFAAATDGAGLGIVATDFDADGWTDLYVANDMTPNFLFRNRGDGTFEETALLAGVAMSDRGQAEAGMGVEAADLDGNGYPDLLVSHLDTQTNAYYSNTGSGLFLDGRFVSGLAEPSLNRVGFGIVAADFDHDGDLDIAVANGHIIHNAELWGRGGHFKQPNQLLENVGNGRFREVVAPGFDVVRASRGMAAGDLDGDGDIDLAISNSDDACEVYENVSTGGSWTQLDLLSPSGNRYAIGARIEIETAGKVQSRERRTASSYLSQNALTLHVGLAAHPQIDALRIHWPDGKRQTLRNLPTNRRLRLVH